MLLVSILVYCTVFLTAVRLRKEIHDLKPNEVMAFISAYKQLPLDDLIRTHTEQATAAHGTPEFFPWHRAFILQMEDMLMDIDPTVTLPYWNWSLESELPHESAMFTDEYFGSTTQGCIQGGHFDNFILNYPNTHCISRSFDLEDKISAFTSDIVLREIIENSDVYDNFRVAIEAIPHGNVHVNIGGDMATMASAGDPLFYLHHAFVDKIWLEYQLKNGPLRYDQRVGTQSIQMDLNTVLEPFSKTVFDVMDVEKLDYEYVEPLYLMNLDEPEEVVMPTAPIVSLELPKVEDNIISSGDTLEELLSMPTKDLLNHDISGASVCTSSDTYLYTEEAWIRMPYPIQEHWLKHMNLSVVGARNFERVLQGRYEELNNDKVTKTRKDCIDRLEQKNMLLGLFRELE